MYLYSISHWGTRCLSASNSKLVGHNWRSSIIKSCIPFMYTRHLTLMYGYMIPQPALSLHWAPEGGPTGSMWTLAHRSHMGPNWAGLVEWLAQRSHMEYEGKITWTCMGQPHGTQSELLSGISWKCLFYETLKGPNLIKIWQFKCMQVLRACLLKVYICKTRCRAVRWNPQWADYKWGGYHGIWEEKLN